MARTTESAVKDILIEDYDSVNEPALTGFVQTASSLVDDLVDCAAAKSLTLSPAKLELIERWLAAHLYCMSDQPYRGRSTLRASGQFQGETGMYLEATKYGQTAITLDPTGCLVKQGSSVNARGFWMGRRPSQQTRVQDRS